MQQFRHALRQMITLSEEEEDTFLSHCIQRNLKRQEIISQPNTIPNEVFFIGSGAIRVALTDTKGTQHSIHFAMENQFVADYAGFMLRQPSDYTLEAVEATQVVVLPRAAIEWGYQHLTQGDRLGRIIAESYFIYHDHRIKNMYIRTPKERYDSLAAQFPNIHNRVPQHMIASYLGITSVHLSRLKKADRPKV